MIGLWRLSWLLARPRPALLNLLYAFSFFCLTPAVAGAQDVSPTINRIVARHAVPIGYRANQSPFSFMLDGVATGYSVELCKRVVEGLRRKLGLERLDVKFVEASAATRFVLMRGGRTDMECASTTINDERRKLVDFSYPHFLTATRFVSLKASDMTNLRDLAGKSVVSVTGTVNIAQLNDANRALDLNIAVLVAKNDAEAFEMVRSGRAAAYVMDDVLLAGFIAATSDPDTYAISSEAFGEPEPYGLMLPLGDARFTAMVNEVLTGIYRSGEARELYRKWFQEPMPTNGANLMLPLSPRLQRIFDDPVGVAEK